MSVPHPRSSSILQHFAALCDPREGWRVLYPSREILLVVPCATLCGMDDFVEVELRGEARLEFLRRFLPFERGIRSHDTLNDVMNGIDADLFKSCFAERVDTLRDGQPDIIAIDGETSRRCRDKARGHATHTTTDADHGRVEQRRHVVCHDVSWMWSDRHYADDTNSLKVRRKKANLEPAYVAKLLTQPPR